MVVSNRSGPSSLELVLALLFVGLFVFVLAFYGLSHERRYEQVAAQRAAQYAKYADNVLRQGCVGLVPKDQQACLTKNSAETNLQKHDNQRDEIDLVAQRKSALWTGIMGLAALIGMGLSAIGVWLIWTTFREAKRTADAALNANKIAENAPRAWVRVGAEPTLVRATGRNGLYLRVDFTAENSGASAATHFMLYHRIFFRPYGQRGDDLDAKMKDQVSLWEQAHNLTEDASLLPNDRDVSSDWKSFKADEIEWKEKMFVGLVAQPMLLVAAIYRTVFEPDVLQVTWRTWYLATIDEKDGINGYVPRPTIGDELGRRDLCADPYHRSASHHQSRDKRDAQRGAA